jgi:OmpA-OmpF porin, OOP family
MVRFLCLFMAAALTASGQTPPPANPARTYVDSRGQKVLFPLGDASFADAVASPGNGRPSSAKNADPNAALGSPNFVSLQQERRAGPTFTHLGCGGTLVVQFTDNVLIDVDGPDLYVFEVGPRVEPTRLAISADGTRWVEVGDIEGGTAAVDIARVADKGQRYRYVRLTDMKSGCSGPWPGADIDAVGAIGAALTLSLNASVLFDFNESTLKAASKQSLQEAADQLAAYPQSAIAVEGHTDNVGSSAYNQKLSTARAESVRTFLLADSRLAALQITATGFGAERPIAENATDEGRQLNRRVEIVLTVTRR